MLSIEQILEHITGSIEIELICRGAGEGDPKFMLADLSDADLAKVAAYIRSFNPQRLAGERL